MNNYAIELLKEYDSLRDARQSEQRRRQAEIYDKIPHIRELDERIGGLGFEIAASIFKDINVEAFIAEQKKRITDLKIEKAELLTVNRYPGDYLELKYDCPKCKDTAYVGNVKCSCFKQKLINKYYAQSNLSDILKRENFDTFELGYYSTDLSANEGISPRENMQRIFTHCISFASKFTVAKESLFFYGNSGLGKTFLSNCIAKDLLDSGKIVIYQTSSNLIETIRRLKFDEHRDSELLEDILDCDLLIVDDLGTEPATAFSHAELFNIINTRQLRGKSMIISTNYSLNELLSIYPERISSRILGNFKMFKFFGADIRIIRNSMK